MATVSLMNETNYNRFGLNQNKIKLDIIPVYTIAKKADQMG